MTAKPWSPFKNDSKPWLLLLLMGLVLFYGLTQPRIEFGEGHPYDSQSYFHMAQQVADGEPVQELRPFASRVALPWLVGTLFPEDLMLGFTVLNLLFALAGLVVLGLYLREFLGSDSLILVLLILYVANPNSPFRFVYFLPAYTDAPALFFISLLLLLNRRIQMLDWKAVLSLSVLGFVGALFRELVFCAILVVSFCQSARLLGRPPFISFISLRTVGLALVPVLAALAGLAAANGLVESTGSYQYPTQMLGVVTQLLQQPSIYPLAWMTAFGVLPMLILLRSDRRLLTFLGSNQDVMLYLAGMALLATVAGFHTDRLVFWAYPALLVVFGKVLEYLPWGHTDRLRKVLFFAPLIVAQVLAYRAFLPIPGDASGVLLNPDPAPILLFSVYGEGANLGHLYASSMLPGDRVTLLIQFFLLAIYFGLVLYVRNSNGNHEKSK